MLYSLCTLVLCWLALANADPSVVARTASLQDSSRTAIFVFVLIAACASVFAVARRTQHGQGPRSAPTFGAHIVFALADRLEFLVARAHGFRLALCAQLLL